VLKLVIAEVLLPAFWMLDVAPGTLVVPKLQVPVPTASIVAEPPGKVFTQVTVLLVPATGLSVTVTIAVSVQVPSTQLKV